MRRIKISDGMRRLLVYTTFCAVILSTSVHGVSSASTNADKLNGGVCRVFSHGDDGSSRIALTFDDGPDPELTPRILDILEQNNVRATFFVIGQNAERSPNIIDRELSAGHEIGNHTYTHKYLGHTEDMVTEAEIYECDTKLFEHNEYTPRLFRPPGGIMNERIGSVCNAMGYSIILWSIDTRDWSGVSADDISAEILKNLRDGAVILMHDGVRGHTAEALEYLLPKLTSMGYECVTVSELIGS